ncbi:MAG: FtsL-like putative cell division protein [Bacteroidia bacterium]
MNKMRQPKAEPETPVAEKKVKKEKKGEGAARNFIRFVNVFGYFDRKAVMSFMPFLMFLFLLAIVYIGNSYYAEKTIRDIDRTEKEIRELRSEFITARSELMYRSKLTEVAASIAPKGVKESTVAPRKIMVHTKTRN